MTDKALISGYTWRPIAMQKAAFPDMQHYVAPDELELLLRPSTRKIELNVHVLSYAVIAENRRGLEDFVSLCKARKATVHSKESGTSWRPNQSSASLIDAWASARKTGAAKAGGDAMRANAEKKFWIGFEKIKDRWHLPSEGANISKLLLAEADTSRNTVKDYLGYTRLEWRKLSDVQRARILKRSKANGSW